VRGQTARASAGGSPTLNVGPSCEAAARGAVILGRNKEACLADETTAQDTLKQNWSKYGATDKSECIGMVTTGAPASYVELLSPRIRIHKSTGLARARETRCAEDRPSSMIRPSSTYNYAQCPCWLPVDNVIPCAVTTMLPFGKTQKR
jgi:hypothetical protein